MPSNYAGPEAFMRDLYRFVRASSWEESHHILNEHPELAATDAGHEMLMLLADDGDILFPEIPAEEANQGVRMHIKVLEACKESGVDATFRLLGQR